MLRFKQFLNESFPKSQLYAAIKSDNHEIIHKGSAKTIRSKVKNLNKLNPKSHYVGLTHSKKIGEYFK